ncbi:MAG: polysaccharide biosynthesis tyrosine autokinase [Alteraurantiacibacter sp.]
MTAEGGNIPGRRGFVDRYLPLGDDGNGDGPASFGIENIRAILWRQKAILIGVTAAIALAALVWTLLTTPTYSATATVRVNTQVAQVIEGQDLTDPYIHPSMISTHMLTLARVIESHDMAGRVVDTLELADDPQLLGDMAAESASEGVSDAVWAARRREAAASALQGGITTELPFDTQLIAITYSHSDPQFAARIANAYVEHFLTDELTRTLESNSYAREYLDEQVADVRARLQEAELEANAYARANGLIAPPTTRGEDGEEVGTAPTLTAANLAETNRRYTEVRARRIEAEQRWQAIAGLPPSRLPEVQQDPIVQRLRTEIATTEGRLADLRQRYRDEYPEVREADSQLETLRGELAQVSAEIKQGLRNDYQIAQRQEGALRSELGQVSAASLDEQDARVQYNLIEREVGSLRDQLAALMARYNQISAASNLRTNNVTALDSARVPVSPSSPNLLRNLLLGLVLGGGLAALLAIAREVLDNRLRTADDVERKLGVPVLGQTPYVPEDIQDELGERFSPISEAYASLRATLDYMTARDTAKVVQFTSSTPAEGKSTSVKAIAEKYAQMGRKVLLVDMDLRRPSLHRFFGGERSKTGLVDVMHGRVALPDALLATGQDGLDLLPLGDVPQNPVEIMSSGLIAEFVERMREAYDVVLIDSSPVMGIADAPLLARHVDAVIFVVEANRSKSSEAKVAIRRLRDTNANIVGAVVTKFRSLEAGQAYRYHYRYYSYSTAG